MFFYHSVLSATTGSCFAALLDGNKPPIVVSVTLSSISIQAVDIGRYPLIDGWLVTYCNIAFAGISISHVITTPIHPAKKPVIIVSQLKTCVMLRFDAPIALNIPISFLLLLTLEDTKFKTIKKEKKAKKIDT